MLLEVVSSDYYGLLLLGTLGKGKHTLQPCFVALVVLVQRAIGVVVSLAVMLLIVADVAFDTSLLLV